MAQEHWTDDQWAKAIKEAIEELRGMGLQVVKSKGRPDSYIVGFNDNRVAVVARNEIPAFSAGFGFGLESAKRTLGGLIDKGERFVGQWAAAADESEG